MGVDCKIMLPDNVTLRNVSKVMGIAAGLGYKWGGTDDGKCKWVNVPNVRTRSVGDDGGMAEIQLIGNMVDGEQEHHVFYHFESSYGGRLMMPRSTAFWIAMAHRLVNFFGGKIDYQDCDSVTVDYKRFPKKREMNSPEDDEPWNRFQQRLTEIKPITVEEWQDCDKYAAYKIGE